MNTKKKHYILFTTLITILVILLSVVYSAYITDLLTRESQMHLSEVATQGAASVKRQVARDFDILDVLADGTISQPDVPIEEKVARMKKQADDFSLFRIALVDLEGNAITSDGYQFSVADREFFKTAIKGERALSQPIIDKVDKQTPGIVYAVPVYHEDKIVNVLFSGYELDTLVARIDISFYHDSGLAFIANSNGDILMHPIKERQGRNIVDVAKPINNTKTVETFKDGLKNGKIGVSRLRMPKDDRFFAYAPIEGANDWFLITSLPATIVFERSQKVIILSMLLVVMISIILILIALYISITKKKSNAQIIHLAYYDALTGIANMEYFKLNSAKLFKEFGAPQYTLLNFDIKQFRYLNKELGYTAGDHFLLHIAKCLSNTALENETFARIGADQFVLLFLNKSTTEETTSYINQLHAKIAEWEVPSSGYYPAQMAFGIYYIKEEDVDVMSAIEKSNIARKSIKNSYESNIAIYTAEMQHHLEYEKELESSMPKALKNDEFKLFIQPKYSLITENIIGGEALVRWIKPDGTSIMPDDFISLFEKTGSIYPMDMYMLEKVCEFLHAQLSNGLPVVPISINQSRCYMYASTYVSTLCKKLQKEDIASSMIELEITESLVYDDFEKLIKVLDSLHQNGFLVSLDDFGSGYSSLNVLKNLPVDIIKLDRYMLSETLASKREKTVVANMIRMAKELEISVIAEGVETLEQVEFLRECGCEAAQGFYYSKPVPADEFEQMLRNEIHL